MGVDSVRTSLASKAPDISIRYIRVLNRMLELGRPEYVRLA